MWEWNSFKYKDVEKILRKLWCEKLTNKKGSHEIWVNHNVNLEFPVVNHWSEEMRIWTLRGMLKIAQIDEEDFLNAR